MLKRFVFIRSVLAVAITLTCFMPVRAQTRNSSGKPYAPPRMPDGHPSLQGNYDLATLTPLERRPGMKPVLTRDEAARLEKEFSGLQAAGDRPIDGNRQAPPKGCDGSIGPAGGVGGYNLFWLDPGSSYTIVNGEIRSSIIVDPPDGRVPPVKRSGQQRGPTDQVDLGQVAGALVRSIVRPTSDASESRDPGLEPPGSYDNPEQRPLGERCLLGFGSTSGPPALPDYFYNNLHQILQTKDYVMILTEMVHDARVIRMNSQHLPKTIRKWMGDSVGHWEGDTLVVDTTNFTDKTRFRGASEDMHVVERFTRAGPDALLYRFTIDDPATWAR